MTKHRRPVRSHVPKSPVARAQRRAARVARTGRRSYLSRSRGDASISFSTSNDPYYKTTMSERLVAADAALEQGRSPRSALGVKHRHARPRLDYFTRAYAEAALWSSSDESDEETGGEPLDRNYGVEDISSQTLAQMVKDCRKFQRENAADLEGLDEERCGHDFWLTRNGHGVGFSDRGNLDIYDRLNEAARKYGEVNLYTHNGKVYA